MEEYEIDDDALQSMFQHYGSFFRGGDADDTAQQAAYLSKVKERLSAGRQASVCLVCLELVGAKDAIWQCQEGCFQTFHLICIKEWARKNKGDVTARSEARLNPDRFPDAAREAREKAKWRCPLCQSGYADIPSRSLCYCGKAEEPEHSWDGWTAPHSCGELCHMPLPCGHECLITCHPGPHPPCPRMVESSCHCGAVTETKRCGNHLFSCGRTCGAELPCGHRCQETCHQGECPPCNVTGQYTCMCGRQRRVDVCAAALWDCGQPCGKTLDCGVHACDQGCHSGRCAPCPLQSKTSCPCGKVTYSGLSCGEPRPSCGATCEKLLPCGVHHCAERCHEGPCPLTCREVVERSCRCGRMQRAVQCQQDFRCDVRCTKMKDCGRHQCRRRCCDGNCPPCEEVCNRKLNCRNHRCRDSCHSGPCRLCRLQSTTTCACGKTSYRLPCGAEGAAQPPRCPHDCPVQWPCRHRDQQPTHRCHWGPCPPCPYQCATVRPGCGHTCSVACHDPPPHALPSFQQPAVPQPFLQATAQAAAQGAKSAAGSSTAAARGDGSSASAAAAASEGVESDPLPVALQVAQLAAQQWEKVLGCVPGPPCPPCSTLLTLPCLGGHLSSQQRCADAAMFSCGAPCGRMLSCGHHTCKKPCHAVEGEEQHLAAVAAAAGAGAAAGKQPVAAPEPCELCMRPCGLPRSCSHPCPLVCHEGECPHCTQQLSLACHCGKSLVSVECSSYQQGETTWRSKLLSCGKACHRPREGCPHFCKLPCHEGGCETGPGTGPCSEEVTVRCRCKRVKRKMHCCKVKELLRLQGAGDGSYDEATSLRLLPCDASTGCVSGSAQGVSDASAAPTYSPANKAPAAILSAAQQQRAAYLPQAAGGAMDSASGGAKTRAVARKPAPAQAKAGAADAGAAGPSMQEADGGGGSGAGLRQQRKSREERAREREAALADKEARRQRAVRIRLIQQGLLLLLVAALAIAVGLWVTAASDRV